MLVDELWIEVFHFLPMKNYFQIVPLINHYWYHNFFKAFEHHFSQFYFFKQFILPFAFPNDSKKDVPILHYSTLKILLKERWLHRISIQQFADEKFSQSIGQYVPFQNVEFAFFKLHPLLQSLLQTTTILSDELHQLAAICCVMESQHRNGFSFPEFHVIEGSESQSNQLEWVLMGQKLKWIPKQTPKVQICSHFKVISDVMPKSKLCPITLFHAKYGVLYPVWLHRMKKFEEYKQSCDDTNAFNLLRWTTYPAFGLGAILEKDLQNLEEVIIKESTQMMRWTCPNQFESRHQFHKLDEATRNMSHQYSWCDYFAKAINYGVHGCCTFWNPKYQILIVMKLAALPEV